MRIDQLLVQRGLAPSRSAAQRLIERGAVRWRSAQGWALPRKAGEDVHDDCELQVTDEAELRYVSRGGLKLEAALKTCSIDVSGRRCLDVGQSTGGFTDCLLKHGATQVTGVDVGHGQLHPSLRADERVTCVERMNARDAQAMRTVGSCFDLIVGDLSFISQTLVWPALVPLLDPQRGELLMLVKPQFELQPEHIGKGGLVRDEASHALVRARIEQACAEQGLTLQGYFDSAITGGDGNREFFVWARVHPNPRKNTA